MTREERIARGRLFDELKRNDRFAMAMKIVKADLVSRWMSVQKNDDARELFYEKQGFMKYEQTIEAYIADGALAENEVEEIEARMQQGPGSAPRIGARTARKEAS